MADALHAYSLKSFTLKANEQKDYYLLLYMDQETPLQEDTKNATWKGKITLSAEYKVDQFANSGTLRTISSSDTSGMWNYKDKLTKIVIETKKSKKEGMDEQNVYGPFNEGDGNTDAIQSYVVCEAEDANCIGYLQGDGGIKLNSDSSDLFYYFTNVTEIEGIENLDTSSVTNMRYMFKDCWQIQELDLSHFDTSSVTDMMGMFQSMYNLQTLTFGENFNTSSVTNMSNMFGSCSQLQSLDLSNFNTGSVTIMDSIFQDCSQIQELDLSNFETGSVANMSSMFNAMSNLQILTFGENFDTSNVTDMSYMFQDCSQIQELDLSSFDTSSVKYMNSMFIDTNNLQELDLSSFDTSSVTNMSYMFSGMSQLQTLTFGENFDTSSVTNMDSMFASCSQIQELDLSNFNTSSVTNMSTMFSRDDNLEKITYGPNFIHKDEATTTRMFYNCPANRPDAGVHSSWEGVSFD